MMVLALSPVPSPRRFRAKVLSPSQLQVWWKEPRGDFDGYSVIYAAVPGKSAELLPASARVLVVGGGGARAHPWTPPGPEHRSGRPVWRALWGGLRHHLCCCLASVSAHARWRRGCAPGPGS